MKHLLLLILLLTSMQVSADAYELIDSFYSRFEPAPGEPIDQEALYTFLQQAEVVAAENPGSLEYQTVTAVVRAAWGREQRVRGLGYLRQAQTELEAVIASDPDVMQGFAMSILARLYATVPKWPLSFGDMERATELNQQVLARFPDSPPVVYYVGLTYLDQDQTESGRELLSRLNELPPYCECQAWTAFLRRASSEALAAIEQ